MIFARTALFTAVSLVVFTLPAHAQEIKSVRLEGVSALPAGELRSQVERLIIPKDLDDALRQRVAQAIEGAYREKGYSLARVVGIELDEKTGELRVTVAEGRLREIVLRGLTRTRPGVIRATLQLKPGMLFRDDLAREDRARLARLGLFDDVQIAPRTPGLPDDKEQKDAKAPKSLTPPTLNNDELGVFDLIVRVKERTTGNVAATVGYGDGTGFVGFLDLSEANLGGQARQISLQWQRIADSLLLSDGTFLNSRPRQAFQLGLVQPVLKPGSVGVRADIYNQNTVFLPYFGGTTESLRSYEKRSGGRLEASRQVSRKLAGFISVRSDQVGYESDTPEELLLGTTAFETAPARIGAWGLGLQADTRDQIGSPRRGSLHRVTLEQAGGLFTQARLDLRTYQPLGKKPQSPTLAVRLLGGSSSGNTPLPEQFFLGGFELLRGYDLFSVRGDRMLMGSVETRFPLAEGMSGVAFGDLGNAWRPGQSLRPGSLKGSLGVGLRFASPFGPIRFDVARGDRIRTYVSLGQSF
jgi:outer membrane protein insertion porin family